MNVFRVANNWQQHLFDGSHMEPLHSFMRSLGKHLPLFSPGVPGLKTGIPEVALSEKKA